MKLNYDAEVPISSTAPFVVNVDPNKPVAPFFRDYIPNMEAKKVQTAPVKKTDRFVKPIVRGADYMSGKDAAKRNEQEQSHIMRIAKDMHQQQATKRQDYANARKLVDESTAEQIEHPTPQLEKALRILRKPAPMDKQELVEQARKQFYGSLDES